MEDAFYTLGPEERVALVREARAAGQPLMIRWADIQPNFGDQWQQRAAAAAKWLAQGSSVADLGCGAMNLERFLRPEQVYIPVDLAKRDERTHIADLNKAADLARLPVAEAGALLGVLEYIYEPHELLTALHSRYRQVVLSFNVLRDGDCREARLANGWVNHFTRQELLALFADHRFALTRDLLFEGKRCEYLFDLRSVEP